jgi:hypothetical protein
MTIAIPYSLDLPLDMRLTTKAAAAYLGVTPDEMRRWRKQGIGPRYIDYGNRVFYRYPLSELDIWKAQSICGPRRPESGLASPGNVVSLAEWRLRSRK